MTKLKKILEFIIALLNFLFHFKPAEEYRNGKVVYPETLPKLPEPPMPDTPPVKDGVTMTC